MVCEKLGCSGSRMMAAGRRRLEDKPVRSLQKPALTLFQTLEQHGFMKRGAAVIFEQCCGPPETYRLADYVERRGAPSRALLVLSGWISEERTLSDGRRQILRLVLPGEIAGFREHQLEAVSDLTALTDAVVADVTPLRTAVSEDLAGPGLAEAWRRMVEAREEQALRHLMRLGRLSAMERTAQLILELYERLSDAGAVSGPVMPMPLTQEQLSDHLGLSVVHLNRILQQLRRDGFIESRHRQLVLRNVSGLASLSHHRWAARMSLEPQATPLRPRATS
jgi:CRP-like cAMP-binding protein